MKVSSLTKPQWRRLIMSLQEVAHELKEAKQEREKMEKDFMEMEDKENEK